MPCMCARLEKLVRFRQRRILSEEVAENMFNKAKASVSGQRRQCCNAAHVMATVLDTKVLEKTHHFDAIDRQVVPAKRSPEFEADTFKPYFKPKDIDKETLELDLKSVVSSSDPDWYSPGATGMAQPYCDIIVRRQAFADGNIALAEFAWLSRLAWSKQLLQKVGEEQKYISLGNTLSDVAWAWPAVECSFLKGTYKPLLDFEVKYVPLVVLKADKWLAAPLCINSPLHTAIEVTAPSTRLLREKVVKLPSYSSFEKFPLVCQPLDALRPIAETATRAAYGMLPLSYIRQFFAHMGFEGFHGLDLPETIAFGAEKLVPGLDDNLLETILGRRSYYFELEAEDLGKILELEFVLDIFGAHERPKIEEEIKSAKASAQQHRDYLTSLSKFKVR